MKKLILFFALMPGFVSAVFAQTGDVSTGTDYDGMIEAMRPIAACAYTVTPENPRALPADEYAEHFEAHRIPARAFDSLERKVLYRIA